MPAPSLRRKISPLLLAALVAVPAASSAAPRHKGRQETRTAAAAPAPLALLERLWSTLTSVWAEEGCHIDPDGRCAPSQGSGLTAPANPGCQSSPGGCAAVQVASPAEG
jgi:hypothetical protein